MASRFFLVLFCPLLAATPLDDYVNNPDPHYNWVDTGESFKTIFGGVAYVLNVTSQKWMDETKQTGPYGSVWTHQVVVVVPKTLKHTNISMTYLTGNCNDNPGVPHAKDEDVLVVDTVSAGTGVVGVVVFQIPNCPIVYPSDPSKKRRTEDSVIAWAWHEYLQSQDPTWLPRLPMTKAAMACMTAVQDFTKQKEFADIEGFVVAGASKRGWTTWTVGMVDCPTCPKILAIAPLVPIVPGLRVEMHRMWRSYGGWTFAFNDYTDVNLTIYVDDPVFNDALKVIDPMYYLDRLARLPKFVVLSSDDEFMMLDWSNIWYDALQGETHLLIAPNSEHSLVTGIPEVLDTLATFVSSMAHGNSDRPNFEYSISNTTGKLSVTIPDGHTLPLKVVARHAQTLQHTRRDFRWVRLANNESGQCHAPDIPLPKPIFGGNCVQPIIWEGTTLTPSFKGGKDTTYHYTPPSSSKPWLAYYIEVYFPSDTGMKTEFLFTTPGFMWPNTLPFPDCTGEACRGSLL